ncbi:MAG: hypothetical protein CMO06_09725 [Thalassospira sp.]|uniref:hypothetical protein n=1 Tax=Thalassospira sp. TaxID=1912094 RepID=UPI000C5B1D08|nr:hypothetical protein [Thalassospira sp.]MAZ33410.1 hypothetical protein [Thalassospira sp.]|tara:strand:- start:402 stop:614 length:213 start_codon:yes stop_codon:yes gene_type:complete
MSKRKPDAVFSVTLANGGLVYVIARHAKGAMTVASQQGIAIDRGPTARPRRVDDLFAERAINQRPKQGAA